MYNYEYFEYMQELLTFINENKIEVFTFSIDSNAIMLKYHLIYKI